MTKEFVISEGNSYEEALNSGLKKINLALEEVEVEVLQEKKAGVFRKAFIELKITKKNELVEDVLKQATEIQETINSSVLKDEDFYKINYMADGVYLTIVQQNNLNLKDKRKMVMDYLSKKEIADYDLEAVEKTFLEQANTPTKIAPYQEEKIIEPEVVVEISRNKMEAYVTIVEGDKGKIPSLDTIREKLNQKGIVYGIDDEKLEDIITSKIFEIKMLIAKGTNPESGKDGKVNYHFDIQKDNKPQLLEDGSVDFKNLNLINNVKEGQLLAEITPPTEGIQGTNVLGGKISAQNGKPAKIIKGKNIRQDDEELKIYSEVDGQVFIRDGKLQVSQIYEIPGDVDNSIGNINFNGNVFIRGNVKSGFTVEASGDIEVVGVVEGATLLSKGNIILNRGIQGNNNAYLQCDGDLISKYIENSTIKSQGNVEADCILHSNIIAKESVLVKGKRGLIVGGQVRATREIRAKTIGSHMGTITVLEVGIDPDEKQLHEKLKTEIAEMKKNLDNLEKTIRLLNNLAKNNRLDKNKEDILVKSARTYKILKEKHSQLIKQQNLIEIKLQDLTGGKIHVSGKTYPGAKITILNAVRIIYDEFVNSTLSYKDGDVTIGPYEK